MVQAPKARLCIPLPRLPCLLLLPPPLQPLFVWTDGAAACSSPAGEICTVAGRLAVLRLIFAPRSSTRAQKFHPAPPPYTHYGENYPESTTFSRKPRKQQKQDCWRGQERCCVSYLDGNTKDGLCLTHCKLTSPLHSPQQPVSVITAVSQRRK